MDADGNLVSGQQEIAAAIFRWAVSQQGQGSVAVPESQMAAPQPTPLPEQGFAPAPVQNQGFAPVQDPAPMPMNNGFMPDSQG